MVDSIVVKQNQGLSIKENNNVSNNSLAFAEIQEHYIPDYYTVKNVVRYE